MKNYVCLIVGYGRMGHLYLKILKKLKFKNIFIISKPLKKNYQSKKYFFKNINEFKKLKLRPDIGIVSTTTDSHKYYVEKLAKLNTKFILVEKPISNSIKNIDEMIKICRMKKSILSVNHSYRFSDAVNLTKRLIIEKKLGKIISINVVGGNMGLAMNGVHFFELFNYLTKNKITEASAQIDSKTMTNPRGKKFRDKSGIILAKNKKKQYLYINISEAQGHGKTILITFKNATIFIDHLNKKLIFNSRVKKNYNLDTRFYATKSKYKIFKFKESLYDSTKLSLINLLKTQKNFVKATDAKEAVKSVIASIESGDNKGKIIKTSSINYLKEYSWA